MSPALLAALVAGGSAGAAAGRLLRLPAWPLTGALLGSAAVHLAVGGGAAALPPWCVFIAQVLVGSVVGAGLGPSVLRDFRRILVPGLVTVLITIAMGVGLGLAIWSTDQVGIVESVFGMVPGGVGEMVAAVASLDGNSALVAGMHVVRLLIVLTLVHAAVRWFRRRDGQPGTRDQLGTEGDSDTETGSGESR